MSRGLLNKALMLSLILMPLNTFAIPDSRVLGYQGLLSAIQNNHPPSGYIDLANCKLTKNVSDMQADRRTYRVRYDDNFTFNPDNGEIITITNILYQQTRDLNGTPILMSRPATIIISGKPQTNYLNYQIVMSLEGKTLMQLYECPWEKAVYLWR